ncbi:MAG TPA: PQQ-binding-like beta-propeller repeat protein [Oligoflexus sp.]|uniref:outer membrane protein assembly factor BamB family protein n=1 Tax=Oligoflexus sp. TaxID=1971216 RepID=UPI002D6F1BD2|nr:PQQ-binding-like beta-propeller repeat protein [Oligoflexus sp.]HYX38769.1 PQQ-binding-like beta-propeller repeat protein [Oligoflexus sp.]
MQLMNSLVLLAGLVSSGSGDIAWQIQGQLSQDAYHRLYQIRSSQLGSQLARIDGKTGATLWEIHGQPYVGWNADCVDESRIYVLVDDRVQAVDAEKGTVLWSEHVNQEFVQNAGYLSCFLHSDQIFLSYTLDQRAHNKLAALRKSDGSNLWTYVSSESINPIGADHEHVYLSGMQNAGSMLQALDQNSGREVWLRQDQGVYFHFDAWQRLLRQGPNDISRVDVRTGEDLWWVPISGSYVYSQGLSDAIYAQSDAMVTRLDPDTGSPQWNLNFTPGQPTYLSTQILTSGDVLLRESLDETNQTRFKVLQGNTGQVRWERTVNGLETFVTEAKDGHLFEQNSSALSLLDQEGQIVWNFQAPALTGGSVPKIGSVLSGEKQLFITLFESTGKYPPTSLAAVDWKTGAVQWVHETDEPLSLISLDQPALIILGTMLSGRSLALYQ